MSYQNTVIDLSLDEEVVVDEAWMDLGELVPLHFDTGEGRIIHEVQQTLQGLINHQ
jgi:hypothetical protein